MKRLIPIATLLGATLLCMAPPARAIEIRKSGKISIPANAQIVPFATDPTVANVLRQDFQAERRAAPANAATPVTLTVSLTERSLKPGVSLEDLAPGDPAVPTLLQEAGETPPPLGDTGVATDEAAVARMREQQQVPPNTIAQSAQAAGALQGLMGPMMMGPMMMGGPMMGGPMMGGPMMGGPMMPAPAQQAQPVQPGDPGYTGDTQSYMQQGSALQGFQQSPDNGNNYDWVIIARVSTSGSNDEMTVLAVVHPGEDRHAAKRLVAEEIANTVLQ